MPRLAIAELWRRLDQSTIDPFYLFFGQEAYLVREYTETLTARILGTAPRDFNYDRYTMADRDSLAEALGRNSPISCGSTRRRWPARHWTAATCAAGWPRR